MTHTGLIRLAKRSRCSGIHVEPVRQLSDKTSNRYTFRATVYKSTRCQGFVGYGDADPNNVSSRVHGAELRVAETRAVNRALRKAYGIASAQSTSLGPSLTPLWRRLRNPKSSLPNPATETAMVVILVSEIVSARSSASTSSIPSS